MQIQLKQDDIEVAIKQFLVAQGVTRDVTEISFTKGRNDSGLTADIEIGTVAPQIDKKVPRATSSKKKDDSPVSEAPEEDETQDESATEDSEKKTGLFN